MISCIEREVYIMYWPELDLIKIGKSKAPETRLKTFQVLIPSLQLIHSTGKLPFADNVESNLHRFFTSRRHHGEFFAVPKQEAIDKLNSILEAMWQLFKLNQEKRLRPIRLKRPEIRRSKPPAKNWKDFTYKL